MTSGLLLCVSQTENAEPYVFPQSQIKIYSLEESLYYVFHHWKEMEGNIFGEPFTDWVENILQLPTHAGRIKKLAALRTAGERIFSFCRLIEYFSPQELTRLQTEISVWEKRVEWEKLKERGDVCVKRGEPEKALPFYQKALEREKKAAVYNNMAIALLSLRRSKEARAALEKALALRPEHRDLLMHYAEACIYEKDYEEAKAVLQKLDRSYPSNPDIQYLFGTLYLEINRLSEAEKYFTQSDEDSILRLADVYIAQEQFERAQETLRLVSKKNDSYYKKQAEICQAQGKPEGAALCIERAIEANPGDVTLWVKLAEYRRAAQEYGAAAKAASKAMGLAPDDARARLENARVLRSMGKSREYQEELRKLLSHLKDEYRRNYNK